MNTKILLALIAITASVSGHAVLKDPSPWNTQPSTTKSCGIAANANPTAVAAATWEVGSQVNVLWQLIAGDGAGEVNILIDTTGSTAPDPTQDTTISVASFASSSNDLRVYNQPITVPKVANCTGPSGLCTLQVHSPNWWSCAYINITDCPGCPIPPPPPPKCTPLGTQLNFCTQKKGQSALLPVGKNPVSLDAQTQSTFLAYVNNPNVFGNNNTQCKQAFSNFLCDVNFPKCGTGVNGHAITGQPCHASCQSTMATCNLQPAHAALYDCSDAVAYPLCQDESAASSVVVGLVAVVFAFVALL